MKLTNNKRQGFTLIEISLVVGVLLALTTIGITSLNAYQKWKEGTEAGEVLNGVYLAQKRYFADFPLLTTEALKLDTEKEKLITYLSGNQTTLPVVNSSHSDGSNPLTIDITQMPPRFQNGGTNYDPSGNTNDKLWDVGE